MGHLLLDRAREHPSSTLLVVDDVACSYAEMAERVKLTAARLAALGVGHGGRVGLLLPNSAEAVQAVFACGLLGAVAVVLNTRFAPRELAHAVADAELEVLLVSDVHTDRVDFEGRLRAAIPGLGLDSNGRLRAREVPTLREILVIGASSSLRARRLEDIEPVPELPAQPIALSDLALMIYTSGTTSMPKGCPLNHEALLGNGISIGRYRFELTAADRLWDPLPIFHLSFLLPLIACIDAGAAFVTQSTFAAGAALAQIRREQVTAAWPAFPAITEALLDHPDHTPESLARIRVMLNVAPPEALRKLQERTPKTVQLSAYGCSEAGGVSAMNLMADALGSRVSTQGKPFPGMRVAARDPFSGEILGAGEVGELVIRGWSVFGGYWHAGDHGESVTADGWLRTGDRGSVAADGTISYRGRYKDMIKVGGENVAALEIESVLVAHPAVVQVAVVGVPDARLVEVPAAAVELRPGAAVTPEELLEHCRHALARYKVPRYLVLRTSWPMSATKIQKFRLRDELCVELGLSE
ncbi:acyl--CoA ligase [Amycolatopsis sp. K13G38]|uniref:Acyl--CoA ligase n=1 Tax=Amycolatopsis acididurans TaxID=2724524 RepID=A0ABX1JFM9_9PSEU|nr:class I adenylate-forming enzyme family protein [Amycolatopsis acididurans]NKQ57220.1 acyl--CoA ligase [Amycolatopsis acididurans]